jgi:hypothetical protein
MWKFGDKEGLFFGFLRLGLVLYFLLFSFFTLKQKQDIRGVESNVVHSLQRSLIHPENLYSDPESLPFHISQYSPAYYLAVELALQVLGITPEQHLEIRFLGRGISLVFLLLAMVYLVLTLTIRLGQSVWIGLDAALFFLMATLPWYHLIRPDALLLLCLSAAVFHTLGRGTKNALFSGLFMALGLATKMNALFFLLPLGIAYLTERRFKDLALAALAGVLTIGALAMLFWLQGHRFDFLLANVVQGVKNGSNWFLALQKTYPYYLTVVFPLMLLIVWLLLRQSILGIKNGTGLLLSLGFVFTVVMSLAASVKVGSAENYFFEPLFWAILLLARFRKDQISDSGFSMLLLVAAVSMGGQKASNYLTQYYIEEGKPETNIGVEEKIQFLKSELKAGEYFVADEREISLALPEHAAMVPVDIHYTTYREGVYSYEEWALAVQEGRIKYWVGEDLPDSLYGARFNGGFVEVRKGVWKEVVVKSSTAKSLVERGRIEEGNEKP